MQEIDHLIGLRSDTTGIYPSDVYGKSRADGRRKNPNRPLNRLGSLPKFRLHPLIHTFRLWGLGTKYWGRHIRIWTNLTRCTQTHPMRTQPSSPKSTKENFCNKKATLRWLSVSLVPKAGLEPARVSPPPPQDGVSTSFHHFGIILLCFC